MADLTGDSSANVLVGTSGADAIKGLGGNDRLKGEGGVDTIWGGNGDDVITLSGVGLNTGTWGGYAYGGDGNDKLVSSQVSDWGAYLNPGLGVNTVVGSLAMWNTGDGDDLIHGDLVGVGGLTVVQGLNGTGTAISGDGRVQDSFSYIQWFELTAENDTMTFSDDARAKGCSPGAGSDTIFGGTGIDELFYITNTGTGVVLDVAAGTLIDPWGATDHIVDVESFWGSLVADTLNASGIDFAVDLHGLAGNDTLRGGLGSDTLNGDGDNDWIYGGGGNNQIFGGEGNDTIDDGNGWDTIDGGAGIDTFVRTYAGSNQYATVFGFDLVRGFNYLLDTPDVPGDFYNGVENLIVSGEYTFLMIGDSNANKLQTAAGNDTLTGGGGADTLIGGAGRDQLTGGAGQDSLIGGQGADRFRIATLAEADKIADFVHNSDTIALSRKVMTGLGAVGALGAGAFHSASGATSGHDANDRVIYDTATGALYYDSDGDGANAAVKIAQLGTLAAHPLDISAGDFLIY